MQETVKVTILIDGRPVRVSVYFESRLLKTLQKLKLMGPTIVGFAPWSVHMRDSKAKTRRVDLAHELVHMLDRETAPWPKWITHPVRSLWAMRHGYRDSRYEVRAYGHEHEVAQGRYLRVRVSDEAWSQLTGVDA